MSPNELQVVNIRMVEAPSLYSDKSIDNPEAAIEVLAKELATYDREAVCVVNLNGTGKPINLNLVALGSLNMCGVEIREIFKSCILSNARAILLVHNHPSGYLAPTREDKEFTSQLIEAGDLLGIPVVDSIICGTKGDYYSFLSNGMMSECRARNRPKAKKVAEKER